MKCTWLALLLLASIAFAQPRNKLDADLLSPTGAPILNGQQLANDILSLAQPNAQLSRRAVQDFTDELTLALMRKNLNPGSVSQLTSAILDVLHSDGAPTREFRATLDRARQALIAMGVSPQPAQRVADRLRFLGQEVRGPEDLPVKPEITPR